MSFPDINEVKVAKVRVNIEVALKKSEEFPEVHLVLYTDGGCDNNGDKIGGWGVHGYWYTKKPTISNSGCKGFTPTHVGYANGKLTGDQSKANVLAYVDYFSGLEAPSTNNIAELAALIQGFKLAMIYPIASLTVHTDSDYVRRGLTEFMSGWTKRNWVTSTGKPVANKEHWLPLVELYEQVKAFLPKPSDLTLLRVKGHSGDKGNDKADELATAGAWGLRNAPDVDSTSFQVTSADNYWGENTFHPIFTESRLFFNPQLLQSDDNFYYQSNLPYAGSETKKEQVLCKRVTDLLLCVVHLNEPEPVIEGLQNYVVNSREYTGVFKTRLDTMKNVDNYQHLEQYPDGRYLVFNDDLKTIQMPNKSSIFNVINQARLSYKIFAEFHYIKEVMLAIEGREPGYNLIPIDITDCMYDRVPKGKNKDVFVNKIKSDLEDSIVIPIEIPGHKPNTITLTFGVDAPSKLGFNKFKALDPKVTLYLNLNGDTHFNYFVHVAVDGGAGLWCAPYSNEILLPAL